MHVPTCFPRLRTRAYEKNEEIGTSSTLEKPEFPWTGFKLLQGVMCNPDLDDRWYTVRLIVCLRVFVLTTFYSQSPPSFTCP